MKTFDYIVIGGGSGGLASARRAAKHGAKVMLVERAELGGTCVHRGCVPKKLMFNAAELAEGFADAEGYGFSSQRPTLDWNRLRLERDRYLERLASRYAENLVRDGVELVRGSARFEANGAVTVGQEQAQAAHVLIATGGRPRLPEIPGAELGLSSDGFFRLEHQPLRVVILGSGYVAVELASVFVALGTEVTLALRKERLLGGFDALVGQGLEQELKRAGVRVVTGFEAQKLGRGQSGELELSELPPADGAPPRQLVGDEVLWAIGRLPESAGLGLEAAGVARDESGHVLVDDWQQTSRRGVYALGDVTGRWGLTPVAIAAGRRLADRLFGGEADARLDYSCIPTVVFSHPPCAAVGLTEEQARLQHGGSVRCYTTRFTNLYHALTARKSETHMKLVVVGQSEQVVGVHVVGRGADEMIQGFAVAVRLGATKRDFDRTVAVHPTAAEELVTMR
jgi:glutathione reductase (NADPH)